MSAVYGAGAAPDTVRGAVPSRAARAGPEPGLEGGGTGFVCLAVPVPGATAAPRLRLVATATGDLDYTPGPGPRLGWPLPVKWADTFDRQRYAWCGERRGLAALPANPAAHLLAARLGCADLTDRLGLRGDLLLAGVACDGAPCDIPRPVVAAAIAAGLLTLDAAMWPPPHTRPIHVGLATLVGR